jgi:hypothetical protein
LLQKVKSLIKNLKKLRKLILKICFLFTCPTYRSLYCTVSVK